MNMKRWTHKTALGKYYTGDAKQLLESAFGRKLQGKVDLILTSPPFPLNEKKSYGNLDGEKYKEWLISMAETFSHLISNKGSIVIEMGNAWVPKRPVQSLLHLESLIGFVRNPQAKLRLCQQFICYNPSRLPSPAEWVTVKRIRTTDSYTHVWWMAKTDFPKADNRRVLRPYSKSMRELLKRRQYNTGKRPSEHNISAEGFLTNHGGSISPNFLEVEALGTPREVRLPNVFRISNTSSNDFFLRTCRERGIRPHPARMPKGLAGFFIKFLTKPGDLVLDPFAGSNTTGFVAECLGRHWISIEIKETYAQQSMIRFEDPILTAKGGELPWI
jgi:site-specific DNA-methyltransferase (cytosine-N4-specific)